MPPSLFIFFKRPRFLSELNALMGNHDWEVIILHFDETFSYQRQISACGQNVDLRDLKGVRFMCDWDTLARIEERIPWSDKRRIVFLGRGDYHYATFLFLTRLRLPFYLLVLDNHLDIGNVFDGYISCGSWLKEALKMDHLTRVVFVNPREYSPKKMGKIFRPGLDMDKILSLTRGAPFYLTIDKDILHPSCVTTNWDQGSLLTDFLYELLLHLEKSNIIGVDICGEPDAISPFEHRKSEHINLSLLRIILEPSAIYEKSL